MDLKAYNQSSVIPSGTEHDLQFLSCHNPDMATIRIWQPLPGGVSGIPDRGSSFPFSWLGMSASGAKAELLAIYIFLYLFGNETAAPLQRRTENIRSTGNASRAGRFYPAQGMISRCIHFRRHAAPLHMEAGIRQSSAGKRIRLEACGLFQAVFRCCGSTPPSAVFP